MQVCMSLYLHRFIFVLDVYFGFGSRVGHETSIPRTRCRLCSVLCSLVALPPMNRLGLETKPFGNAVILPAFSSFVGLHKAITHMQDGVNDKTRFAMFSRNTLQKSFAGVTTRCDFSNMQPSHLATAPALDIFLRAWLLNRVGLAK